MFKKMPVGISDFKKLIENIFYYVNKTLLIKNLLDNRSEVNLITRPRRFGKTINMSMLKYYFENLAISKYPNYKQYQGKYPLIFDYYTLAIPNKEIRTVLYLKVLKSLMT